jgi:hypothetical protein
MLKHREDDFETSAITIAQSTPDRPDTLTRESQKQLENEKLQLEVIGIKSGQQHLNEAVKLSRWFAIGIFTLVFMSLVIVFSIIIWQGIFPPERRLNDKVIITLLSTTTIDIIGLLYLVIKYVFHHRLKI